MCANRIHCIGETHIIKMQKNVVLDAAFDVDDN